MTSSRREEALKMLQSFVNSNTETTLSLYNQWALDYEQVRIRSTWSSCLKTLGQLEQQEPADFELTETFQCDLSFTASWFCH